MSAQSKLLTDAIEALSALPGVGKRSAMRMALYLLKRPREESLQLIDKLRRFVSEIKFCRQCHHLADGELCEICASTSRDTGLLCVVESVRDVMAIEDTGHFNGVYHVLGGVISPVDGVGPDQLHIESLRRRLESGAFQEVLLAISPTVEGETTIYYLSRIIQPMGIRISTLSRGVAFGGELEYTDELTLGRSILARRPYKIGKE